MARVTILYVFFFLLFCFVFLSNKEGAKKKTSENNSDLAIADNTAHTTYPKRKKMFL